MGDTIQLRSENNPLNRIDPNGLTDYTLDKKTGDVKQVGEKNDDPDRILKTNKRKEKLSIKRMAKLRSPWWYRERDFKRWDKFSKK